MDQPDINPDINYTAPSFLRDRMRILGRVCDACNYDEAAENSPTEQLLQIDFRESTVILCGKHEGWLLTTLLGNYVKRRAKGKPVNFILRTTGVLEAAAKEKSE